MGAKPHRSERFKLWSDPLFVEKLCDVDGLYVAPPAPALVLCVDEKNHTQALDRSLPLLLMRRIGPRVSYSTSFSRSSGNEKFPQETCCR